MATLFLARVVPPLHPSAMQPHESTERLSASRVLRVLFVVASLLVACSDEDEFPWPFSPQSPESTADLGLDGSAGPLPPPVSSEQPVATAIPAGASAPGEQPPVAGPCAERDASWDASWKALEAEVVRLVNVRRAQPARCGDDPFDGTNVQLVADPLLTCAAREHSEDMATRRRLDHEGGDGRGPFGRIRDVGYSGGFPQGENVAMGYASAAAVVDGWMSSPGHCANIMNASFNEIGVGYHAGSGAYPHLWTQKFGRR